MKKFILLFIGLAIISCGYAQLTGIKTIPGDYASIATAITDLNAQGAGPGGVTFSVVSGHTETLPSPTAGLITASGLAANPILFQNAGGGVNPMITAATPGTGTTDGIFVIAGGDYITFDGISIQENPANTTSNMQMEWGYALVKANSAAPIDGCQSVVIKNCTISLNQAANWCTGIYAGNHTAYSTSSLTLSETTDAMNNGKFYNNVISHVYNGFIFNGYYAPAALAYLYDQGNEIGVDGGNQISDFGGGTSNIYGIGTAYQNNLKIANNSLTGIVPGNGTLRGIYLGTGSGGNPNVDIYSNTVSMERTATTGNMYCIYPTLSTGVDNTVNIYNNIISNNTYATSTAARWSGSMRGLYISGSPFHLNIYGNQVNNNTLGSLTTPGTHPFYGIYFYSGSEGNLYNIHDNTVNGNIRLQMTPDWSETFYLFGPQLGGTCNVYNNQVDNNTPGGTTYDAYGIRIYGGGILSVHDNSVTNITAGQNFTGIAFGGNGSLYRNKVANITAVEPGAKINGVSIVTGSTGEQFPNVFNNFISGLYTSVSGASPAITGINVTNNSNISLGCFYNTIYLDASSTESDFSTAGIYTGESPTLDLRNNIIVNNSVPGTTGKTVAYQRSDYQLDAYSSISDNNCFYSGVPGPQNLIFSDGTSEDIMLDEYKMRVYPRDKNSFTGLPPFLNATTLPYDLHLSSTVLTECESGGSVISAPLSITNDYDDQPRYPNPGYPAKAGYPPSAPDVGADEFGGMTIDLTPPAIGFTPLNNTSSSAARDLVTSISDKSGVPTSGNGLPRLYWNFNHGAWQTAVAVFTGGDQYTFTFGAGGSAGDSVFYYIVAQDNFVIPNVGSVSAYGAGGYTTNPPACTTPPNKPVAYKILASIAGVFPVGVGQIYQTLQAAVTDLNGKEMVGPVTFVLYDENYTLPDDLNIEILPNFGMNFSNTLTIKPNTGVTPEVSGNANPGILTIHGADYVTIDGSPNNGNDQNITWVNNASSSNGYVLGLFANQGDHSTNTTIKNCVIKGGSNSAYYYSGIRLNNNEGGHDSTIIHHNVIKKAYAGIYYSGASGAPVLGGQITDNFIGSYDDAEKIYVFGIYVQYTENLLIDGNEIMGSPTGSSGSSGCGIRCSVSPNTRILNNRIHDFHYLGSYYSCYGIYYNGNDTTPTKIINNLIYNISGEGMNYSNYNSYGILINSGSNIDIWNNSVYLSGEVLSATSSSYSACLAIGTNNQINNLDVRNNIFQNTQTAPSGTSSMTYLIYTLNDTYNPFSTIDFNDYNANGIEPRIGKLMGQDIFTLTDWQAATGQDTNSVDADPMFVSASDLHPQAVAVNNTGIMIPEVTTDIDGVLRTNPPDMGAYEFALLPDLFTSEANPVGQTSATLHGATKARNEYVTLSFEYGLTTSYGDEVAATPSQASGNDSVSISADISGLEVNSLYHYRTKGITLTDTAYGPDMTVDMVPSPSISGDTAMCVNSGYYYYTTEEGKSDYQWAVSAGGSIVWGAGTNEIKVSWNEPDAQWVSINWANSVGTLAPTPTLLDVDVQDYPDGAGSVTGIDSLCAGTYGIPYSVAPIGNTVAYVWTLPAGATIASGSGTNAITVDYNEYAASGNISVYGNNLCGNGTPSPPFPMTIFPIPPAPVITQSSDTLYSTAPEGNQWYYEGTAIAGATSSFLIPTEEGEYWTEVTLNGCMSDTSNHLLVIFTGMDEPAGSDIMIYPVPNDGRFIVSMSRNDLGLFNILVVNNMGNKMFERRNCTINKGQSLSIDLRPVSNGVYIVILENELTRIIKRIVVMD